MTKSVLWGLWSVPTGPAPGPPPLPAPQTPPPDLLGIVHTNSGTAEDQKHGNW